MKQNVLTIALLSLLFTSVTDAETSTVAVINNRTVQDDITTPGGTRRLSADQTAALRESLNDKLARDIILLIGDGMGNSEIAAAQNHTKGAGGSFKDIDTLLLTGQYTHHALDKRTGKPDYMADSAASVTARMTGIKAYNSTLGIGVHEEDHATILEMVKAAGPVIGNASTTGL